MQLEVNNLRLSYPGTAEPVLKDVSLSLAQGSIGCLLGGSGCGKTTLLRAISGFETPDAGSIKAGGVVVLSDTANMAPEKRRIGMVFQSYSLFPQLSVARNVMFGLRGHADYGGRKAKAHRCAEVLKLVGLSGYEKRYPHELSGGQQQRVALARALAPAPTLLLLDEPFSNLDAELRARLSIEVRNILKACGSTALLVTHDQNEAFATADEIGVMEGGRILQWSTAYDLYHKPQSRYVANFVGNTTWLRGRVLDDGRVDTELGILPPPRNERFKSGLNVDVLLRPDDLQHDDDSELQMIVRNKAFRGVDILYTLELPGGGTTKSLVPSHHNHRLNQPIGIRLEMDHVMAFPADN